MTKTRNRQWHFALFAFLVQEKELEMKTVSTTTNQSDALWRLTKVLEVIPVSRSHWWDGVKSGKYPASIKLSERITCWRRSEIMALLGKGEV